MYKYLNREYLYFVGNVLIGVRNVFLTGYYLVLSQLKLKSVDVFLNQRNV